MSSIVVQGDTSGSVTLSAPAVAGSVTVTLPAVSGTMSVYGGSPTYASITDSGNLTFTGTGSRITGDFTNATVTNRLMFQTSTANSSTGIYALPSGSSTAASWQATNNADPTNASKILIATNGSTDVQLVSGINGTGTYLPLTFYTSGAEKMRLDTSGNLGIGVTPSASSTKTLEIANVGNTITTTGSNEIQFSAGAYYNAGWKYAVSSAPVTNYYQSAGVHYWRNATSGTAGNAITWTQAMTLDTSGTLLVGTATTYGGRLNVVPSSTPTTAAGANALQIGESTSNTGYRVQLGVFNDPTNGYVGSVQSYGGGSPNNLVLQGAGGNLLLGITSATSGGGVLQVSNGITFPATQSASSNANTLDDYEEGTWTPVYVSTGATFTYVSTSQYGSYRKIGSLVIAQFYLLATATGTTTNSVQIQGLPFACVSGSLTHGSGFAWQGGAQALGFTVSPAVTNIDVWKQNGGGAVTATAANVTSTGAYVVGTIIYNAA